MPIIVTEYCVLCDMPGMNQLRPKTQMPLNNTTEIHSPSPCIALGVRGTHFILLILLILLNHVHSRFLQA